MIEASLSTRLASVSANVHAIALRVGGTIDDALRLPIAELDRIVEELEEQERSPVATQPAERTPRRAIASAPKKRREVARG